MLQVSSRGVSDEGRRYETGAGLPKNGLREPLIAKEPVRTIVTNCENLSQSDPRCRLKEWFPALGAPPAQVVKPESSP